MEGLAVIYQPDDLKTRCLIWLLQNHVSSPNQRSLAHLTAFSFCLVTFFSWSCCDEVILISNLFKGLPAGGTFVCMTVKKKKRKRKTKFHLFWLFSSISISSTFLHLPLQWASFADLEWRWSMPKKMHQSGSVVTHPQGLWRPQLTKNGYK